MLSAVGHSLQGTTNVLNELKNKKKHLNQQLAPVFALACHARILLFSALGVYFTPVFSNNEKPV
jgi:hypothetical protein